jgi:hypothetical protein
VSNRHGGVWQRPGWAAPHDGRFGTGGSVKLTANRPFTFKVAARANQAYVLVRAADGGGVYLAKMQQSGFGRWEHTLRLPPGTHAYRFYLDVDGVTVVEPGWAAAPAARRDGLDAVVEIPSSPPNAVKSPERLTHEVLRHV